MKDEEKTKEQLIKELAEMRQRVAELEASEAERKRAEEALKESEERYRAFVHATSDMVFVKDERFRHLIANKALATFLGKEQVDIIGKTDFELMPAYAAENCRTSDLQALETQSVVVTEEQVGGRIYETTKFPVPLQGDKTGVGGIIRDITERKRAEEALRETRDYLESLINYANAPIIVWDPASKISRFNHAFEHLTGYTADEVIGQELSLLFPEASQDESLSKIARTLSGEYWESVEIPILSKVGDVRVALWNSANIYAEDGTTLLATIAQGTDITERKRTEEALAQERNLLRALMDNVPDYIYFKDRESRFIRTTKAHAKTFGLSDPAEAIGKADFDLFSDEHAHQAYEDEQEIIRTGQPLLNIEERETWPDRPDTWVLTSKMPLRDEEGKIVGTFGISKDITERKRAEEEVRRHLERIEALREVDRAITSTLDLTEVLNVILAELERVIAYHSAGIFFLSDDTARLAAGRGFPDMECVLQVSFSVEEDALTRQVLREKRPLVLADAQADDRFRARGGTEYVRSWIGLPLIVKDKTVGFLTIDHREPGVYDKESAEMAEAFASQVAIAIENARLYQKAQQELAERKRAEEELRQSYVRLQKALEGTVNTLVSAIEMRDPYTAGHQRGVTRLACAIANEMGLPEEQIEGLRMAGLIHDMGKITIPAEILSKPGRLSDLEWGIIKAHPQVGYDVLKTVDFPWPVAEIVLQHHERMDGSGYPQGLAGEEIMLEARILAVADVVEAMASHRPYRSARGLDKALEEISQNGGILYDPEVVDICLKLFTEKRFKFE
jgi:PAS domain S-box-containing protein